MKKFLSVFLSFVMVITLAAGMTFFIPSDNEKVKAADQEVYVSDNIEGEEVFATEGSYKGFECPLTIGKTYTLKGTHIIPDENHEAEPVKVTCVHAKYNFDGTQKATFFVRGLFKGQWKREWENSKVIKDHKVGYLGDDETTKDCLGPFFGSAKSSLFLPRYCSRYFDISRINENTLDPTVYGQITELSLDVSSDKPEWFNSNEYEKFGAETPNLWASDTYSSTAYRKTGDHKFEGSDKFQEYIYAPYLMIPLTKISVNGDEISYDYHQSTGIKVIRTDKTSVIAGEKVDLRDLIEKVQAIGGDNDKKYVNYKVSTNQGVIYGNTWIVPTDLNETDKLTLKVFVEDTYQNLEKEITIDKLPNSSLLGEGNYQKESECNRGNGKDTDIKTGDMVTFKGTVSGWKQEIKGSFLYKKGNVATFATRGTAIGAGVPITPYGYVDGWKPITNTYTYYWGDLTNHPTIRKRFGPFRQIVNNIFLPEMNNYSFLYPHGSEAVDTYDSYIKAGVAESIAVANPNDLGGSGAWSGNINRESAVLIRYSGTITDAWGYQYQFLWTPTFDIDLSKIDLTQIEEGKFDAVNPYESSTSITVTRSDKTSVNAGETINIEDLIDEVRVNGGTCDGDTAKYIVSTNDGTIENDKWIAPTDASGSAKLTVSVEEGGSKEITVFVNGINPNDKLSQVQEKFRSWDVDLTSGTYKYNNTNHELLYDNGLVYEIKNGKTLIGYTQKVTVDTKIASDCTGIASGALDLIETTPMNLEAIHLPSEVSQIYLCNGVVNLGSNEHIISYDNNGFVYDITDNKKLIGYSSLINASSEISKDCKEIGDDAFLDIGRTSFNSRDVVIPFSVEKIGKNVFTGLGNGFKVTFKNPDVNINKNAFDTDFQCDITLKVFKGSYTEEFANAYKRKEPSITVETMTEIPSDWFEGETVATLTVPNGVTRIEDGALEGHGELEELNLSNVESIGSRAFKDCEGLSGLLIVPSTVTEIGNEAFYGTNYRNVIFLNADNSMSDKFPPEFRNGFESGKIKRVTPFTFGDMPNETVFTADILREAIEDEDVQTDYIYFGPYLKEIADGAFKGVTGITVLLRGATNLEKIGNSAFEGSDITEIYLGKSVNEVGQDAFKGCPLTNIVIENPNLDITPALTGVDLSKLTITTDKGSVAEENFRNTDVTMELRTNKNIITVTLVDDVTRNIKLYSGIRQKIHPPVSDNTKTFLGYFDSANKQYFDAEGNQLEEITSKIRLTAKYGKASIVIKFDANGGEGTMENMTAEIPDPVNLPDKYHVPFVKEGYKFAGWSKTPNGFAFDDPVMDTSEYNSGDTVTLYAIWKKCFTISLIGGDELETSETGEVLIPKTAKAPEGKVIIGYSTKENDTKPEFEVGKTYRFTKNVNIYPVFADGGVKYKVVVKKMTKMENGNPYYETTEKEFAGIEGEEITAKASVYGKDGVTIATEGEYELEKGYIVNENSVLSGTISKDLVLTVILDKIKVSLNFDKNSNEGITVPAPITDYWGEEITLEKLDNENFLGWALSPNSTPVNTITLGKEGNTVYAIWKDNKVYDFPITATYKLTNKNTVLSVDWGDGKEFILLTELGYTIGDGDNEIIFYSGVKNKTYRLILMFSDTKNFKFSKNTATYTKADNKKSVVIPDTITKNGKKYKITQVGANAFKGKNKIVNLTFGKYVTKVGKNAAKGLKKLKNVTFKSKKVTLEKGSFANLKLKKFKCKKITAKKGSLSKTKATFYGGSKSKLIKAGANKKSKFKK